VGYKQAHKGKVNHHNAARKLMVKTATPPWVNKKIIESIYINAAAITEATGIAHHVDHIMPIKHPLLCGLNVPWNLQILSGSENCSKKNNVTL